MDAEQLAESKWRIEFADADFERLHGHLFPGDNDEHGAVVGAGITKEANGVTRLLVREIFLAKDGVDFVESKRGYRKLRAEFVRDTVRRCIKEGLVYLAVHNHGGRDRVAFSGTDLESHERGYPALLDLSDGRPVGALVFAENAVAGDIWLPGGRRCNIERATVVGRRRRLLRPAPRQDVQATVEGTYDRQARLFGASGQLTLKESTVVVIGLGGVGSLIAEYLGHLGVGKIVLIDPDRIDWTNLPRVVGATRLDAFPRLQNVRAIPEWIISFLERLRTSKVRIARRNILRANPSARVVTLKMDVCDARVTELLAQCDYIFLAADSMRARLLVNAVVHQYLIPAVQVGSKIQVEDDGHVGNVFSIVRPVSPGEGCLWCNQVINPSKLQDESVSAEVRKAQQYVEGGDAPAPSVITLNAVGASRAVNDFLFYITGLTDSDASEGYIRAEARSRKTVVVRTRKDQACTECSKHPDSRFARGDAADLPGVMPA